MIMFGIIQNLQTSPIPQTSFLTGTFCHFLQQSGSSFKIKIFCCSEKVSLLSCMNWITLLRPFFKTFQVVYIKTKLQNFCISFLATVWVAQWVSLSYVPTILQVWYQFNHFNVLKTETLQIEFENLFFCEIKSQSPRIDLNKWFLPRPNEILSQHLYTAWKLIPHRSNISKSWNPTHWELFYLVKWVWM